MPKTYTQQQSISYMSEEQATIEAHIAEYEKLREFLSQSITNEYQVVALAVASASIAVPVLAGLTNISETVLATLLYLLAIVYAVYAMILANNLFMAGLVSKYIHDHIEPEINRLLKIAECPERRVFYWESFIRKERANPIAAILGSVGPIGGVTIILAPSLMALVVAQLVLPTSIQQDSAWLPMLSVISWICFGLGAGSLILAAIYNTNKVKWASRPKP